MAFAPPRRKAAGRGSRARSSARRADARLGAAVQLQRFIDYAPVAIAMFDRRMHYVAASRRWLADYALAGAPVRGRSHYHLFPDLPARWKDVHQRCLAGASEQADQDLFVRADGRRQWIRWAVQPWRTSAGRVGGIVIFAEDVTSRAEAEIALRDSERRLARLAAGLTAAEQRVRDGLARTLHDDLQQLLFSCGVKLDLVLRQEFPSGSLTRQLVGDACDAVRDAAQTARRMSAELSPLVLNHGDLPAALRWLQGWMQQRHQFDVRLHLTSEQNPVQPSTRVLLFESARELLFNAVKHAGVRSADLTYRATSEHYEIEVRDEGKGFAPPAPTGSGFGLAEIHERLSSLGGRFVIESAAGAGVRAALTIPRHVADAPGGARS